MYYIFCLGHIELRNVLQSEQRGSFEQHTLHGAGHSNNFFTFLDTWKITQINLLNKKLYGTARWTARPPPAVPVWGAMYAQEWDKAPRPATPHTGIITTWQPGHGLAEARDSPSAIRYHGRLKSGLCPDSAEQCAGSPDISTGTWEVLSFLCLLSLSSALHPLLATVVALLLLILPILLLVLILIIILLHLHNASSQALLLPLRPQRRVETPPKEVRLLMMTGI